MKNYFLFVLLIFILVSVDHPTIAKPRQEIYDKFMSFLDDSSKVKTDQEAARALKRILERLRLSGSSEEYINKQLNNNGNMKRFETRFCKKKELNSYFYGDDMRQICRIIKEETTQ